MNWQIEKDVARFLSRHQSLLSAYEDHNNMLLQAISFAIQNPSDKNAAFTAGKSAALFFDSSLIISHDSEKDLSSLAVAFNDYLESNKNLKLLKVLGPEAPVQNFTRSWLQTKKGTRIRNQAAMVLHKLTEVVEIQKPQGHFRRAWIEELELLTDWLNGFWNDVGLDRDSELTEKQAAQRMIEAKQLFVWVNPRALSMAAVGGSTPKGIRVHSVYTPPELRGKGYAKAAVASIAKLHLDQGKEFLVLYTDALKPENGALYKEVGFHPIANHLAFFFD